MLKNSKIKIVSIVPRLQARLVSVIPSYSMPKLVSVKANSVGHGIKPTFTRTSTAYKSDGSVVNAGVPRIESGKGTLVEEGTVNLLPANQQSYTGSLGYFRHPVGFTLTDNASVSFAVSSFQLNGQTGIDVICDGAVAQQGIVPSTRLTVNPSTAYTISAYVVGSGTVAIGGNGSKANYGQSDFASRGVTLSDIPQKISLTFTTSATETGVAIFIGTTSAQATTFKVVSFKLEAKPYATTFHPSTRTAESLTVPASALSVVEGTIEFDVYSPSDFAGALNFGSLIRSRRDISGSNYGIGAWYQSDAWVWSIWDDNDNSYDVRTSPISYKQGRLRFGLRYKNGEDLSLFINGAKKATRNTLVTPTVLQKMFIGSQTGNQRFINAYFSNLRISNKARTDAELANVGTLSVDEYTTYFAPMTSDLTAYTKGNGNAVLKSIAC